MSSYTLAQVRIAYFAIMQRDMPDDLAYDCALRDMCDAIGMQEAAGLLERAGQHQQAYIDGTPLAELAKIVRPGTPCEKCRREATMTVRGHDFCQLHWQRDQADFAGAMTEAQIRAAAMTLPLEVLNVDGHSVAVSRNTGNVLANDGRAQVFLYDSAGNATERGRDHFMDVVGIMCGYPITTMEQAFRHLQLMMDECRADFDIPDLHTVTQRTPPPNY